MIKSECLHPRQRDEVMRLCAIEFYGKPTTFLEGVAWGCFDSVSWSWSMTRHLSWETLLLHTTTSKHQACIIWRSFARCGSADQNYVPALCSSEAPVLLSSPASCRARLCCRALFCSDYFESRCWELMTATSEIYDLPSDYRVHRGYSNHETTRGVCAHAH